MAEESNKESNVKSTIEAMTGLVKAVPIYDDAIQPAAKQVGKSLETISKAVNIALAPLRVMVWGIEKIEGWLIPTLTTKLAHTPIANIVAPDPQVAGPSLEALRYMANKATLREMFANLIVTSMDSTTTHLAHPSYVEILKNISVDEGMILKCFLKEDAFVTIDLIGENPPGGGYAVYCSNFSPFHKLKSVKRVDLIPAYIDNLCRLGLIEQPLHAILTDDPDDYELLANDPYLDSLKDEIMEANQNVAIKNRSVWITSFGRQFVDNVVQEKPCHENH